MRINICPQCGKTDDDSASVCINCGAKMQLVVPSAEQFMALAMAPGLKHNEEGNTPPVVLIKHLMSDLIRNETLDGVPYLVMPTVLITVGVHNNVFYSDEELRKFPEAWNGVPVVVYHPEIAGVPVSANRKDVIEQRKVGVVLNVRYEDGKLKGEVWIDPTKANQVDEMVMTKLNANQRMEVSTGLFTEDEMAQGVWNGEQYEAIARNHRPDHLALLPEGRGACSWEDGAGGPRVNKEQPKESMFRKSLKAMGKAMSDVLAGMGLKGNLLSHGSIRDQFRGAVQGGRTLADNEYLFVEEMFDGFGIYSHENSDGVKLYKQAYTVDAQDQLALAGEPVEVMQQVSFVPVTNEQEDRVQSNSTKTEGEQDMDRKERIDALIAAEGSDWEEQDREALTGLSDEQFDKVERGAKVTAEPPAEQPPAEDEAPKENEQDDEPVTVDTFLANAPEEVKETLTSAVKLQKSKKDSLVKGLMENKRNKFTKEQLEAKTLEELESLASLAQVEVSYKGQNPAQEEPTTNESEQPDEMPDFDWGNSNG